jgi:hypothetical protein
MGGQCEMRAPANYQFVDLADPAEAEYWLIIFDATRAQLEEAMTRVGVYEPAVREYLQASR